MSFKEVSIAKVNDLNNGEMKSFPAGEENEILLTKIDGQFYAVGAHCTHYGAPLAEGVLCNGVIICPWHHACFNAKTGDLLEHPAMDSLRDYEVKIKGDEVIVKIPDQPEPGRLPEMTKKDIESDKRIFIILGGGAAGNAAAQALREAGFKGNIVMITQENRLPYDRPNLSKAYLSGEAPAEWMPLRSEDFYKECGIEVLLNKKVKEVNISNKEIITVDNEKFIYDKLLIATGGTPRKLNVPGSELKNIFYLRSFNDSDNLIQAAKAGAKVVVIGSSFIGMETASGLHERKLDVTVISPENIPFENVFGEEIGMLFKKAHEEHGIKFKLSSKISKFEGKDKVETVVLENGERIKTDFAVVGIGVKPATDFIKGIDLQKDGSIKVNEFFQVNDSVYAVGDIAQFPDSHSGQSIRIEHWGTAEQQGRVAGFNMTGRPTQFNSSFFFWTEQAGINLKYVGYAKEWDSIYTRGDISSKEFISFFIKNGKVIAAAGNNRDKEIAAVDCLMRKGKVLSEDKLKDKSYELLKDTK
jgi:NADPH-dependent 2,4-dienoyl-CoA reductase/sulfur reductase-like enzyme/nitrite reductase/ring-hydroxylating ferredoxin subunit